MTAAPRTLAECALAYAERGIAVFPLQPGEKKPYGHTTGLLAASAEVWTVGGWWRGERDLPLKPVEDGKARPARVRASPGANIGIATGAKAGFWVLDIDGPEAQARLDGLISEHGALSVTPEQETSRGRHICFAWDDASRHLRNSSGRVGPHIDTRAEGGYIVAAPSLHPSGKRYAWAEGRSPFDLPFAPAPAWLIALASPPPEPEPTSTVALANARSPMAGQASRYGEAALDRACREIAAARVGTRDTTLYRTACSIARLVAGGEIEGGYARSALIGAGQVHVPSVGTLAQLERQVDRALEFGASRPKCAPERPPSGQGEPARKPASPRLEPVPMARAAEPTDPAALWAEATHARGATVEAWLRGQGLDPALPGAVDTLRLHRWAPLGPGRRGPALLAPLIDGWCDPRSAEVNEAVGGLMIVPLEARGPALLIGPHLRRAAILTPTDASPDQLLVAVDLVDAWSLAESARARVARVAVAITPRLRSFAGGWLGDRYGRVDPDLPDADADDPPWLAGTPWGEVAPESVWLAVRGDLTTPELAFRRSEGGTGRRRLFGEPAARFWGGLAEQAWRRAGANRVRVLRPAQGVDFRAAMERAA